MKLPNSSGVLPMITAPSTSRLFWTSAVWVAATVASRSLADDLGRRALGHREAVPCGGLVVGQADLGDGRRPRAAAWTRSCIVTASGLALPLSMKPNDRGQGGDHEVEPAADQVGDGGASTLVGYVHHVERGGVGEQERGQMAGRAVAGRAVGQAAGIGLRPRRRSAWKLAKREPSGTTTTRGASAISVTGSNAVRGSILTFLNRCGLTVIGP